MLLGKHTVGRGNSRVEESEGGAGKRRRRKERENSWWLGRLLRWEVAAVAAMSCA